MSFECPVLKELRLTEDYDPEFEQKPHLTGGDYDIDAIRECGDGCELAMLYTALRHEADRLKRENAKWRRDWRYVFGADITVQCLEGCGVLQHVECNLCSHVAECLHESRLSCPPR